MKPILGTTPSNPIGSMDAVHVGVVVGYSWHDLAPGTRVRLEHGGLVTPVNSNSLEDASGVVDPFNPQKVPTGHPVYVLIKPSLIEEFSHKFNIKGHDFMNDVNYGPAVNDDGCRGMGC